MKNFVVNLCDTRFMIRCQTPDLYDEQMKVVKKMLPTECIEENTNEADFVLTYSKNQKAFEKMYGCIKSTPDQILKPYMNETMFKGRSARFNTFVRENKDFIALQRDDQCYSIVSNPANSASKKAPYTILLEIFQKEMEAKKIHAFHSTGFVVDNTGLLVLGQSKSGKTTLFSKLSQCSDIDFLSNDRVLSDGTKMMAFPIEILLSMGTVKHDTNLSKFFKDRKKAENWLGKPLENTSDNEKCGIKPTELLEIYPNLRLIQESKIDCIILPRINFENKEDIKIAKLSPDEAKEKILDCDFTLEDKESPRTDWIYPSKITNMEKFLQAKTIIEDMTTRIPVISLEYGCDCDGRSIREAINEQVLTKGDA